MLAFGWRGHSFGTSNALGTRRPAGVAHPIGPWAVVARALHARVASVASIVAGTLAQSAFPRALYTLAPFFGLLGREDLLDFTLEGDEHFSCRGPVFLAEGANAFMVCLKDFADLLALFGCEIEVTNEARSHPLRGPRGIFAGPLCLRTEHDHGQGTADHGARDEEGRPEEEGPQP